ncbi:F0F1 ATP synthase subunit delta [Blattabacterium cuenoti]|uniref:F0F1 ATP synthase subunit delta n=1 Tax=Blattabacterium cuenoti TaxID=1653831 RepID=UPI00163B6CC9|nr:F0F1 ATP synthase subunit delta [Blattabacterium cuenoti]
MFLEKIIKHYAFILFESSIMLDKNFYKKIKKVYQMFSHEKFMKKIMYNAFLTSDEKISIFKNSSLNPFLFHFIKILILQKRELLFLDILKRYMIIYEENIQNIIQCVIITSIPINEKLQQVILKKVDFYKKVTFHVKNKIDQSIIGGFLLRIGYKELDFSIKRQLVIFEKKFK